MLMLNICSVGVPVYFMVLNFDYSIQ